MEWDVKKMDEKDLFKGILVIMFFAVVLMLIISYLGNKFDIFALSWQYL